LCTHATANATAPRPKARIHGESWMAGVFGLIGRAEPQILSAMAHRLAHRGSAVEIREVARDVHLACVAEGFATGIIDHADGALVADAALYDSADLYAELGLNDSGEPGKLIVTAYQRLGSDGLAMVNGEFALAFWDDGAAELILARDFVGVRPLYYTQLPSGGAAFASEYKALLALDEVSTEPDLDMVHWLQHTKHLPSGRTLLRAVRAVPPGTVVGFDRKGGSRQRNGMPPLRLAVRNMSLGEARTAVRDAFMQATASRVGAEPSLGVALSGGIDSIGVACASRQLRPDADIHTFTVGSDRDDPEIVRAEFVAESIGATQHSIIVTPTDMISYLPHVVWHLESPIARTETVQFYALGQKASGIVDRLLTGVAADGLFAGMPRHKILWLIRQLPYLRGPLAEFYNLAQAGHPPETMLGRLIDLLYFRGSVPPVPAITGSRFRPPPTDFPDIDAEFLNRVLCAGFEESVASWLPKHEKTLSAAGLSFTSPFLDRRLMRVAFEVPSAHKIWRGKEKYVLRQAIRSIVPDEVLNAPKFPMRMRCDEAFSSTLDTLADRVLSKDRVERRGFMDFAAVQRLRRRRPRRPYSPEGAMRLWTALLTEIWAHQFVDLRGAGPAIHDDDVWTEDRIGRRGLRVDERGHRFRQRQPAST
jgi:asparagine synthase (glutamine-hydrolysing)